MNRILIAASDATTTEGAQHALASAGFQTAIVGNANQLIDFCRQHQPDLVIIDLELQGGSVWAAAKTLRSIPNTTSVPFLGLGNQLSDMEVIHAQSVGFFTVQSKPVNAEQLIAEVRTAFGKFGGTLGETGSVGFMFDRIGIIMYPKDKASSDEMFEAAVEAGAENCETNDEFHEITTSVEDLGAVRDTLEKKFGEAEKADLTWSPNTMTELDKDKAETMLKLIDALEDDDDVQIVTTNMDVDDAIMEELMGEE